MKIKLNSKICYLIGICNRRKGPLYISTKNNKIMEKFIEIAVNELKIKPDKITIQKNDEFIAYTYNSKITTYFKQMLQKRELIFKYINDYSSNYFAGLFDNKGDIINNHIYFKNIDLNDQMILEKFNIHLKNNNNVYQVLSRNSFIIFMKRNSIKINLFKD